MDILFIAAIIPIIALCYFIYHEDKNKEPKGLLALIFFLGVVSVFPIIICELAFDYFFPADTNVSFPILFLQVFFGVALIEEIFKWFITKFVGYNNKEFDEIYDIIVYSVFASLGFACFENVLYVLSNGLGNAFMRGLLAVPGHTCFAISMGYFLSRAKIGQLNGSKNIYNKNIALSIVVPMILHTLYDALLMAVGETNDIGVLVIQLLPFLVFYVFMVVTCFITVDKTAKMQQRLTNSLNEGTIVRNNQGYLAYNNSSSSVPAIVATEAVSNTSSGNTFNFCPVCGKPTNGGNFCTRCGFKLK